MGDILDRNQKTRILIAGPCVIQSWDTCFEIAAEVRRCGLLYNFHTIFKASFDKANRTSVDGFRGIGIDKGLDILRKIRERLNMPVITDVHETSQVEKVAAVVDYLQIPAFLCRQTDLIQACAKTGLPVLIKKGQFLSPEACKFIENKFYKFGGSSLMIGERGNIFGYNDLIVDVTSISRLKKECKNSKIVMDCTHSLQRPNGPSGKTEGRCDMVEDMVKFAAVMGADGLFIETHPYPELSPSDSENMLNLSKFEYVIKKSRTIYDTI
ncbi:MAG: 3-deoxy-8-phosphooctulonate synthase [Spirochaetia bacterium]|nr:3-deoxy-8-phosphooctulonate synthase [Spirochaetia bacterium]